MGQKQQMLCPECNSPSLILGLEYPFLDMDEYCCNACGTQGRLDIEPVATSVADRVCPHCGKIADFETSQDEEMEWCLSCGLDPDREHSSLDIAHLWKKGSPLYILLDSDDSRFSLGTDRGLFIRTNCGPHCEEAENCKQDFSSFELCFNAGRNLGETDVSRKSRRKKQRQAQYIASTAKVAQLLCANSGWLARRLYGTDYKEPHRDSESGSGVKAVS